MISLFENNMDMEQPELFHPLYAKYDIDKWVLNNETINENEIYMQYELHEDTGKMFKMELSCLRMGRVPAPWNLEKFNMQTTLWNTSPRCDCDPEYRDEGCEDCETYYIPLPDDLKFFITKDMMDEDYQDYLKDKWRGVVLLYFPSLLSMMLFPGL